MTASAEWRLETDIFTWTAFTMVRWSLLEFRDRVLRFMSAIFSLPWNTGRTEKHMKFKDREFADHTGGYLASGVLLPPTPRVGKLGNDLAPQGAVRRMEEACSGANVPWCYFAVSEITSATNQEIPGLKSVARCSDAILRAHA
jgi:hypothetical protein